MELEKLLKQDNLIIFGCQEYPFPGVQYWGGMGTVCKAVCERLVHLGFEVLVLPRRVGDYTAPDIIYEEKNGVHILSIPAKTFQAGIDNADLYQVCPTWDATVALDHSFTTWNYLVRHGLRNTAIFHGHDWLSVGWMRAAKRFGLSTVFSVHMSADRTNRFDKRLELERLAGKCADIIHFVSLAQKKSCQVYDWENRKKQIIIHNGVDTTKFKPAEQTASGEEYVLFVGRLTYEKNVPALVKAWSQFNQQFSEVGLKILGAPGPSLLDVKQEISKLPVAQREKVELKLEIVPLNEKIRYYQNAAICAFPSLTEAFGIVALEAQACGKPVVVGNVGGFWENTLEGVTGIHVDCRDINAISEGLTIAYLNRETWGKNAVKFVNMFFDWNKLTLDYVNYLYKPLLEE